MNDWFRDVSDWRPTLVMTLLCFAAATHSVASLIQIRKTEGLRAEVRQLLQELQSAPARTLDLGYVRLLHAGCDGKLQLSHALGLAGMA